MDGRLGAVHDRQYPAFGHHGDPVAEGKDLVEVLGDNEHRGTSHAFLDEAVMDVLGGTDVDPPSRMGGQQDTWFAGKFPGQD